MGFIIICRFQHNLVFPIWVVYVMGSSNVFACIIIFRSLKCLSDSDKFFHSILHEDS